MAVAEGGVRGEVREYGRIANTPTALRRLAGKLCHRVERKRAARILVSLMGARGRRYSTHSSWVSTIGRTWYYEFRWYAVRGNSGAT